jgi:hypothetical protein
MVSLPNEPRLLSQLRLLERKVRPGGREVVDAGKTSDDAANAVCGLLRELDRKRGFLNQTGWMTNQEEKEGHNKSSAVEVWRQAICAASDGQWWG